MSQKNFQPNRVFAWTVMSIRTTRGRAPKMTFFSFSEYFTAGITKNALKWPYFIIPCGFEPFPHFFSIFSRMKKIGLFPAFFELQSQVIYKMSTIICFLHQFFTRNPTMTLSCSKNQNFTMSLFLISKIGAKTMTDLPENTFFEFLVKFYSRYHTVAY